MTEAVATGQSIARFVEPVSDTLSPVMTERHLAWHYDVLEFPLDDILHAAHAKHNDAFRSAITAGLNGTTRTVRSAQTPTDGSRFPKGIPTLVVQSPSRRGRRARVRRTA